jgi:hypothetical protein
MVKQLFTNFSFRRKKPREQFMITIPDPCGEKWAEMKKVDDCHRHCTACDRTLTDFSVMSDDELVIFFKQNNGKVCGRFRKDQLNRPLAKLPEKTSKATWWKAAALLPLSLFSKSGSAQQLYPDSAKTEQLPSMCIPNDSLVVDWEHAETDTMQNWRWLDPEELQWPKHEVTGGVPLITITTDFICTIAYPPALIPAPIGAETSLGAQSSVVTKKESTSVKAMRFANEFHAIAPAGKAKE